MLNLSPQTFQNRALERSWKRFWVVLRCLGQSWRVLGASGARLGCAVECQRLSRRRLGAILGRLGAILGRLGRLLDRFGGVLEVFWEHFWKIFCYLEPNVKIAKNVGKPMVFP